MYKNPYFKNEYFKNPYFHNTISLSFSSGSDQTSSKPSISTI